MIHKFQIGEDEIHLEITYKNGLYTHKIIKGQTGTGGGSGGASSLSEWIKRCEAQHRYSYSFFGYPK